MNKLWEISHCLYKKRGGKALARVLELINFIIYSNAISCKAVIGEKTVFHHHGCGCVVHDDAVIGINCDIFQNVTIGSKWSGGICDGKCPVIGNDVFIGAGAVLIGNIRIGNNCVIGANAVVMQDLPDHSTAIGVPAKIISRKR